MSDPQIDPVINAIHTPCKKCVFAEYKAATQVSCSMGMLDRFREKNIEILEAYDEEKEFYIVNSKKCFAYKDNKYFAARKLSDISLEEKIEYVKKILHINYVAVVNLKNIDLKDLYNICDQLINSNSQPKKIILIRYYYDNKKYNYNDIKTILDATSIPWRIQTILDDTLNYSQILHTVTNTNKNNNHILSIDGYTDDITNIINYAQDKIYTKLESFSVVSNSTKNIILYNNLMYRTGILKGIDILNDTKNFTII